MSDLLNALKTGFIDKSIPSIQNLQPTLLLNDKRRPSKVLGPLLDLIQACDEFWFSVAFLTNSGIAALHNTLRDLETLNKGGKILVSQYLYFTHPEALKALRRFSNIEPRLIETNNFHGKGYLFRKDDHYQLIMGSSNLTAEALTTNTELNIQLTASQDSKIVQETLSSFERFFDEAKPLTDEVISRYEKNYKTHSTTTDYKSNTSTVFDENTEYEPNSMQKDALFNLDQLRKNGVEKSLLISATGTGKTVLAGFDVKASGAKKMLFVVHRGTIARKAMQTFKSILGSNKSYGLYSGDIKEAQADFVFATVQTMNLDHHLHKFDKQEFDYIIIDETHRAGGKTYHKIFDYFKPQFLMGMTATPERTDGFDIFSLFNHNIAYEIRLKQAMEENLLSPFHYFGITDISVNGRELNEKSDFSLLVSHERVDRIIEVSKQYGSDNGTPRGLIFCSRVEEAKRLSELFNQKGFSTIALSGSNSQDERTNAITKLESDLPQDKLDYIFTVDIFNEGIDIPSINQIIMLRPTQSAIIFVQQLGRGLRNSPRKDYLTVIDFIGNYQNNYMIPIALYGDSSYNKDTLRKLVASGSSLIPGSSTVNFDKISKEKIFQSINTSNISTKKDLIQDYRLLKYRLGRVPTMIDFLDNESRDPFHFVEYSKSYFNFVALEEEGRQHELPNRISKLLEYLSKEINNGKRLEENIILKLLVKNRRTDFHMVMNQFNKFGVPTSENIIKSAAHNLNLQFITERKNNKTLSVGDNNQYEIVHSDNDALIAGRTLNAALQYESFADFLEDSVEYSISKFMQSFALNDYVDGFQRYQKYSRKDVFRILKWVKNPVGLNVGGYQISQDKSNCAIFVNYHKQENISDTTKYKDQFINPAIFTYMSKNKRNMQSDDVLTIKNQKTNNIRLPLFIKKSNDEGLEFYYMGDLTTLENTFIQQQMDDAPNVSVVKMNFELDKPVEQQLYKYMTDL